MPPKHDAGPATRHYRAFWQRRCRAAAAAAVLKPVSYTHLDVYKRQAQTGQLDVPDTYLAYQYENVATVLIDGTEVTLSQNPGRNAMASWTRNGFDYLLLCEEPQMNLLGGVIQDFVTQTTASTVSGQRVTQE